MPRCGDCNGCLNHQDQYNCDRCKFCRDTKRLGGAHKLKKPCEYRTCVTSKKDGSDVERMVNTPGKKNWRKKSSKTDKPPKKRIELKKRKRKSSSTNETTTKVPRRDSGFENGKLDSCDVNDEETVRTDSGVGSNDGDIRDWGRLADLRREEALVQRVGQLTRELGSLTGGEVTVTYRSREHPCLPGSGQRQTEWNFPAREIEVNRELVEVDNVRQHGAFLARLGVTEEDVLKGRMPSLQPESSVVVPVGLGLDLARLGNKRTGNKERVVDWLLNLWELSFPDQLRAPAVSATWDRLQENSEYVDDCDSDEEIEQFVKATFTLPEDVIEMAMVSTENQSVMSPSSSPSPCSALQLNQLLSRDSLDLSSMLDNALTNYNDDNFNYTATVLDIDQLDSLMLGHSSDLLGSDPLPLSGAGGDLLLQDQGVLQPNQHMDESRTLVTMDVPGEVNEDNIKRERKRSKREVVMPAKYRDFTSPASHYSAGCGLFKS